MNKVITSISIATILSLSSSLVIADNWKHENRGHYGHDDYAKVIHVEPLYRYVQIREPHHECWSEPSRSSAHHSYTGTIAGGIIGGVIGNQFGGGSGKKALTVAGTLLGGSIGRDYSHSDRYQPRYTERCQVSNRYHDERISDGYEVTYRYHGLQYTTHMDHHPGKRIPVDVHVKPQRHYY